MSGYETYRRFQRIEDQAKVLGFRIGNPKHGGFGRDNYDAVGVFPGEGDSLPVFSRDAELFVGTFREVEVWLSGWARAQQYDMLLRISDEKRRKKAEAKELERQRLEKERIEKRKMFAALSDKSEKDVEKLIK